MPADSLSALQHRLQHRFSDPSLLQRAVTHRSYSSEHNERLEFLGDSVLNLAVSSLLFRRMQGLPEGELSRVRALLRRSAMPTSAPVATARLQHDAAGQRMLLQGSPLPLTRMEYGLLACLLEHQGRILARDYLLDRVWGLQADSADRTVDTHVKTLRAKLREADPAHDYIVTHRGMGYSLTLPATP